MNQCSQVGPCVLRSLANFLAPHIFGTHLAAGESILHGDRNNWLTGPVASTADTARGIVIHHVGRFLLDDTTALTLRLATATATARPDESHHESASTEATEEQKTDDCRGSGRGCVSHRR